MDRVDGAGRARQHADAALPQRLQPRRRRRRPGDHEGLAGPGGDLFQILGDLGRRPLHQPEVEDPGVDLRVFEHQRQRLHQELRIGDELRRDVDRVPDRAERGHDSPQRVPRGLAQLGDAEAELLAAIGHQDAGAAGLGDDPDARARRQRAAREGGDEVEELLVVPGPDDPRLAEDAAVHAVRPGERSRVRRCRASPRPRARDLHHHDRLAEGKRARRGGHDLAAVLQSLDVAGHHPDPRVLDHVGEEVAQVEVGLVAAVDEIAERESALARELEDRGAEGPALGDEADRSRRRLALSGLAEGRHHPVEGVHEAERVGAEEPEAALARERRRLPLERPSLLAHLAESRAEHHRRPHLARGAVPERRRHARGRHRHDREVDGRRDRAHARIAREAGERSVLRVHGEDPARVALVEEELERSPVDLHEVLGGPDDGDGARAEQRVERGDPGHRSRMSLTDAM